MSYAFRVAAATKAEAKEKIAAEFDAILANQPVHAVDRDGAQAAACAMVDVLADPTADQEVVVSVNGYVSWNAWADNQAKDFRGANVSVAASVADVETVAQANAA